MAAVSTAQAPSASPKSSPTKASESTSQRSTGLLFADELDEAQWDWTCSMPLSHVTFILNCMMPTWHPSVAVSGFVQAKRQEDRNHLMETYADQPDIKGVLFGGFEENLAVPTFVKRTSDHPVTEELRCEADVMLEAVGKHIGNSPKYQFRIDTSCTDVYPGYLRVFYTTDPGLNVCVRKEGKVYLPSSVDGATVIITDRNLTTAAPGMESKNTLICLPCPEWPKQASSWIKRERSSGWPSKTLRDDIVSSGCHIIPLAHPRSSWPEAEWRYSFARAEVKLCQSLSVTQRQCYMLFKTFVKCELMPSDLINSYCLKIIFLTSMEKIPPEQWEDKINGLGAIFLYLLDELLYALINHDLQHYFIPKNNLIEHIPEDFVDDLMANVSKMRRDPVKYILSFDKKYKFPYSPKMSTFSEVFAPLLEHSQKYDSLLSNCRLAQIAACDKLYGLYLTDLQFQGAWEVSKLASKDPLGHLNHKILQFPPDHAAVLYEGVFACQSSAPGYMLRNLARMYTNLFCAETDGTKKADYHQKADINFQKAISEQEIRGPTAVDYVVFLRNCNRAKDGIPLLLKFLPQEKEDKSVNTYAKSDRDSLDDNLKAELDETDGDISAPSVVLGFYQLAQCYFETGLTRKVQEIMPDFTVACEMFPEKSIVDSLLGYTYFRLEDYDSAYKVFGKVLGKRPDDRLAAEKSMLCKAMLMSLSAVDTSTAN